jgi:hypothetical protein
MSVILFATALLLAAVLRLAYKATVKMIEPEASCVLPQKGCFEDPQDAKVLRYIPSPVHMWQHIAQTTNV